MDYESALAWLYSTQTRGIKLGLQNSYRLLEHFCRPAPGAKAGFVFHIAGTNGKGSVCAYLESMLLASGHSSGMLTSPHLVSFTERIRLNGRPIRREAVAREISHIQKEIETWEPHPTFFELATVIGYSAMLQSGVEGIVLETGLGGRLDSTTAIPSDVSVISSISFDHQATLGYSLAQIAFEKAGIIKPGKPVVFPANLPPEARAVILEQAEHRGSPVHEVLEPLDPSVPLRLAGRHQFWNAALALQAFSLSPFRAPQDVLLSALAQTEWPARFQRLTHQGVQIVIDGAHNPAAAQVLAQTWIDVMGSNKPTLVFGTVRDKDPCEMMKILRPICGDVILTTTPTPRGNSGAELAALCGQPQDRVVQEPSEALSLALRIGRPVLITGSLFLAGKFLEILDPQPEESYEPSLQ